MENELNFLLQTNKQDDLAHLIHNLFGKGGEKAQLVQNAMSYQFNPVRKLVYFKGLELEAVLNHARLTYVKSTIENTQQVQNDFQFGDDNTKRSLRPHMLPPGSAVCPFCHLEQGPLFIGRLLLGNNDYALLVNPRPWGYRNVMLVTRAPEPQSMTLERLRNSFDLIKMLGSDYEGIFTGILAGASVYHFHLQIHKGAAAIWTNLESKQVNLKAFFSVDGATASYVDGWPTCVFAFEGSDLDRLADLVSCMIETFVRGHHDFPYNIGFRCQGDLIRLLLFPRSGEERPPCIQGYPDSWGRFGFLDLGGSVFMLTPEAYGAIGESGHHIYDAITQMSIQHSEQVQLISAFQTSASHRF